MNKENKQLKKDIYIEKAIKVLQQQYEYYRKLNRGAILIY